MYWAIGTVSEIENWRNKATNMMGGCGVEDCGVWDHSLSLVPRFRAEEVPYVPDTAPKGCLKAPKD